MINFHQNDVDFLERIISYARKRSIIPVLGTSRTLNFKDIDEVGILLGDQWGNDECKKGAFCKKDSMIYNILMTVGGDVLLSDNNFGPSGFPMKEARKHFYFLHDYNGFIPERDYQYPPLRV